MGNTAEASTGPGATRTQLRRWFVGYFLNLVGSQAFYLALAWYARESTGSDSLVGAVTSLCALCRAAFLVLGGILADRKGIDASVVATNVIRTGSFILSAAAIQLLPNDFPVLLVVSALYGCTDGLFLPAAQILPKLYPPQDLPRLQALMSFVQRASSIVGPMAGGTLVAAARPSATFALISGCFLFAALTMRAPGKVRITGRQETTPILPGQPHGFALPTAMLPLLILLTIGEFVSSGILTTGLPLLFLDSDIDSVTAGFYLSLFGIGASVSSLLLCAVQPARRRRGLMLCGVLGMGTCFLFFATAAGPMTMEAALTTAGFCSGLSSTLIFSEYLSMAGEDSPAKAMALLYIASYGTAPVATSLMGCLSELHSPTWAISVFAVMLVCSALLYLPANTLARRKLRNA